MLLRFGYSARPLRRLVLLTLVAALASTATAAASLRTIRRDAGETTIPRLRAGTITIPAGHRSGRIRVIVRLSMEPLAAWHADRVTSSARAARRLDVRSASSRAYLARLNAAQRVAIAQLHRSIPQALVQERYRVVLNGFAVSV